MKKRNLIEKRSLATLAVTAFVLLANTPATGHAMSNDKEACGVLLAAGCASCGSASCSGSAPKQNYSCAAAPADHPVNPSVYRKPNPSNNPASNDRQTSANFNNRPNSTNFNNNSNNAPSYQDNPYTPEKRY